jgi:hypothetical protein
MSRVGRRLYGTTKTGQHEYDDVVRLKDEKPSVAKTMHTFLALLAKLESKASSAFHGFVSSGCAMTSRLTRTYSLCHLMCLTVLF